MNLLRYCPDKKEETNQLRCSSCIFSQEIKGDTDLYNLKCMYISKMKLLKK